MPITVSHAMSLTVADGTNTNIVRPSDWNSGHLFTLNVTGSEISGAFSNANGISFGLSAGAITASHNALTTAMASNRGTDFVQATAAFFGTNASGTIGSNGISVSVAAPGAGGGGVALSAGTNSTSTGTVAFANSNGVSFGMDTNGQVTATVKTDYLTTAMASNRGTDFVQANAAFAGTNASGTIASNGLSVSVAAQSVQPVAASAANGSYAFSTLSFSNANGISFGTSAGSAITASHNGLTSQSNQAFSAGGGSSAFQTLGFSDANGITWTNSNGSVAASYSQSTHSHSTGPGAVAAGTQTGTSGTIVFANSNNFTFGMSGSSQITASFSQSTHSHATAAYSAANGSFMADTVSFSNLNGISFGTSAGGAITASHNALTTAMASNRGSDFVQATAAFAGTNASGTIASNGISISVAAPGGAGTTNQTGPNIGVSNLGNTAGSTGTVSTGNVVFAGSQGITLSQSTGGAGSNATISIIGDPPISRWLGPDGNALTFITAPNNAVFSVNQMFVPDWVSGTRMEALLYQSLASSATANTYGQQWSVYMGIYSNDTANSRLVSLSSGSTQTTYTNASNNSGVTQILGSGIRPISCPVNFNLQPGEYYVGFNYVTNTFSSGTATTALARTVSLVGNAIQSASYGMVWDYTAATAATNNSFIPAGVASAASTGLPGSISYSQITMTGASRLGANFAIMFRGQ